MMNNKGAAREMAIDDAKQKAEALAAQLGVTLGKITGFSENTSGYPVPMYEYRGYGVGGGERRMFNRRKRDYSYCE